MMDEALAKIEELSAAKTRSDMTARKLIDAVNDLARMLEAVRYTSGLGQSQVDRIDKAKATAREAAERVGGVG